MNQDKSVNVLGFDTDLREVYAMEFSEVMAQWGRYCGEIKESNELLNFVRCARCDLKKFCSSSPIERAEIIRRQDIERAIMDWAKEHPEYPTWYEYLTNKYGIQDGPSEFIRNVKLLNKPLTQEEAALLGVKPKNRRDGGMKHDED